jgi:hypothetical protein
MYINIKKLNWVAVIILPIMLMLSCVNNNVHNKTTGVGKD